MKMLISFGSAGYESGLMSLFASAHPHFDRITLYKPQDIDEQFLHENHAIMNLPRGYGYWLWKPYFILRTLKMLEQNDYLMYCDSLVNFVSSPQPLFDRVDNSNGIILFDQIAADAGNRTHLNKVWTKKDCFSIMCCDSPEYTDAVQLTASFVVAKRTPASIEFLEEWLKYCQDINVLTDAPNTCGPNYPEFREHRHDQSILSLLSLKRKIKTYKDISQYGNGSTDPDSNFPQIIDHHRRK